MTKVEFRGLSYDPAQVILRLSEFLTEERLEKIINVVERRSHFFIPVLENLYDRGNVSAVMRSSEAFGFYKMHVVQTNDSFKESKRVTQGAEKWLEVEMWSEVKSCVNLLKNKGYNVFTTSLSDDAKPFSEIDFSQKTAIVLGNEKEGVSEEVKALSDGNVLLPMQGFTQSFNISVAAALCFQTAKEKNPPVVDEEERTRLKALYILKTLSWSDKALAQTFQ